MIHKEHQKMKEVNRYIRRQGEIPPFDPFKFAYKANRSTSNAVSTALHTFLNHLEKLGAAVDFSSAFDTIIPDNWLPLTHRRVEAYPHSRKSSTPTLSTRSPTAVC